MTRRLLGARLGVDLRGLRWAGIAMLGAGAVVAHLPGEAGIPCLLRSTTGVPCPACGMTTSVKAALRLDLAAALSANPFGVVAVLVAVVLVARPRWRVAAVPLVPVVLAAVASWAFQLHRFGVI